MVERGISANGSDEELGMLNEPTRPDNGGESDTSYKGAASQTHLPYQSQSVGIGSSTPLPYPHPPAVQQER